MAYFPHAFQKVLLATNGFCVAGHTKTIEIEPGKLAVVNAATNVPLALTDVPTYSATPLVYLAQGSLHSTDKIGPFHGGYQETVKSKGINPKYVSQFYVVEPSNAQAQEILIGKDSVVTFMSDKTYSLRLDVKGSAALRFLTHNLYHTFDVLTGCANVAGTPNSVDPAIVFEGLATQIANDPIVKSFVQPVVLYNIVGGVQDQTAKPAAWATTANADKFCQLKLSAAYIDTKFGNCSFSPKDHFEIEPIRLYASVSQAGEPCADDVFPVIEVTEGQQGNGYGESILRELILSKSYGQEPFQRDVRLREVLDDNTLNEVNRESKYVAYYILHSIPRASNSNGMLDADQYLLKVIATTRNADFEDYLNTLLTSAGSAVQLEVK